MGSDFQCASCTLGLSQLGDGTAVHLGAAARVEMFREIPLYIYNINYIYIEYLHSHRIIAWLGLEWTLKIIQFQLPVIIYGV